MQALRSVPAVSGYDSDRAEATIKLMVRLHRRFAPFFAFVQTASTLIVHFLPLQEYLKQADRKDSYIRYIYVLVGEHLKCNRPSTHCTNHYLLLPRFRRGETT